MGIISTAKRRSVAELIVGIVTVLLLCYISGFVSLRLDLTSDKRYTLNPITKDALQNLNDVVYVRIYLDGDLPIGFLRMRRALKETMEEFRVYGGRKFHYEFINPTHSPDPREREALFRDLHDMGLEPINVQEVNPRGGTSQRLVFPGAIVSHGGREAVVNLLRNKPGLSSDENINLSVQGFEYNFISAIEKLARKELPKVAFVHGHGQLDELETGDIAQELATRFEVHRVFLGGEVGGLDPYSVVIMAGPSKAVPEADKLVLDQYIMGGGRVLWLVDGATVSIDSLSRGATTLAFPSQHNLNDMLFRYGVRINHSVVQDIQCAMIPVNVSIAGQEPRFAPVPWNYYPLLSTPNNNPITRNLNLVKAQFASPIDTVGEDENLKKTVLLRTSRYSRTLNTPLFVNLRQIEQSPLERDFKEQFLPIAVLVEGVFSSVFANRPIGALNNGNPFKLKESSAQTRIIVVGNSHIIRNEISRRPDGAYITPLGYDRYSNQTYGNKELIVNMVNYLNDFSGIINLRSRDHQLRLLDRKEVLENRVKWQVINMVLPSLLLIVMVVIWVLVRRMRYAR